MIIKIKNIKGLKKFIQIILISLLFVICPINTNSAELLQIKDVDTILVGDQNRNLNLSLYCIDISENNRGKATEMLKKNFPRGTKVKIKPYGTNGNSLLAKIYRVDNDAEMTELLKTFDFSEKNCVN